MYTEAIEQLRDENIVFASVLALWHNGNQAATYAELVVLNDDTNATITPSEADLIEAYARWQAAQAIRDSETEAQELTKAEVKALLATELVKATPDTDGVYVALQAIIGGNTRLENAHQNTANLYGYDTATPLGYLRAAYLLIALMS